jgi:tetratricopeptide (TPR) repeat protein
MQIKSLWCSKFSAAALLAAAITTSNAATTDIKICSDASALPSKKVAACTRLIKMGKLDEKQLSIVYTNRGAGFGKMGNDDQALADFTESIRIYPNNGFSYYNRGDLWYKRGKFDWAIEDLTKTIRLEPSFAQARMARAVAFLATNDGENALQGADEMVKLLPDSGIALETRAYILKTVGRRDEAVAEYRKALAVEPNNLVLTKEIEAALRGLGAAP